jgi:hypothetical protein
MNLSALELAKKLPDYTDLLEIALQIEQMSVKKAMLEGAIKLSEANVIKEVTSNPIYFQAGKIPSMVYIDATYKFLGLENELPELRQTVSALGYNIEKLKTTMDVYRTMIGIWQTLSANERKSSL